MKLHQHTGDCLDKLKWEKPRRCGCREGRYGCGEHLPKFMERHYRATETTKLSIRLSETVGDILLSLDHFCEKNGIPMDKEMCQLIEQAGNLLIQISEMQTLPLHELLKHPPAWLPNESKQGQNPNEEGTAPV